MIILDNSPSLLQFENVFYTYPGANQAAIEDLSLSIPAGKRTAILGHNGCGKSTLLLLADGLYRCSAGVISWQGKPMQYQARSLNQWRQRIGLAFQDPEQQLVAATVEEDISYGLCNLQLSQSEIVARLDQTLSDFNLQELANRPLHYLSLGQKRRVALAGVMALQPQLLLLDEPTAYLDRLQTRHLMQELDRIHGNGTTIVMATHDLDLAYGWADWAIVLHQGRVLVSDQADQVFNNVTLLEQLELGMPTLWEIWNALPMAFRDTANGTLRERESPPKTVAELRSRLMQYQHCQ
ncbi:putative enzyme [Planktothrix serta PCC 8927]|uniref:Enzyme n=1 Tax=Planktothrix serta PCC 8927 TaxID=671068 RepID=A0A7Z9BSF9_9CYAN|nr:putative enzyme [Planktothrix serta PCC 8927]